MASRFAKIILLLFGVAAAVCAQQNSYSFGLDTVDAHIVLMIRTVSSVPCYGTSIRTQTERAGDSIVVIISGLVRPTPCIEGFDPASARVVLGRVRNENFYLRFREGSADDLWSVVHTAQGFTVSPIQNSFTSSTH